MRVQAIRAFNDLEAGCRRERGSEFEVAEERGARLADLGLVKQLEQEAQAEQPKKKTATRRRAAKPKE